MPVCHFKELQKTPMQIAAWETYCADIKRCNTAAELLRATHAYAGIDKACGSRAYNRAKKAMEILGYFADKKWEKKGFGAMGVKLREDYYNVFLTILDGDLHYVKIALLNQLPQSFLNMKKGSMVSRETLQHTLLQQDEALQPCAKRAKTAHDGDASMPPAAVSVVALAAESALVMEESAKSVRAARLADAMQHPSFGLLTKQQQMDVRDEWLSMLQ